MGYTREWLESAIPGGRWQPNGEYKCAIRDERTPSCFINLEKRTYNDYGGNSGKLSDLLREMNIPDPYQGAAQAAPTPGSKSDTARRLWEKAQPATRHPYCDKKGISPDGCRVTSDGLLLVPGWNENGEVVSIERISPDGTKRHYGPKDGAFFLCGDTTEDTPLLCAEGFSTAATLHALTGWPVAASFGAANLPKVVRVLGRVFPGREIGACPDADAAGAKAGDEAALAGACVVSLPEGVPGHFDWNDCAHRHGVEIVKGMFQDQWQNRRKKEEPTAEPKVRLKKINAVDLYNADIRTPTWAVEQLLPGGLSVLASPPKTGKSYFVLQAALAVAQGVPFLGQRTHKGRVLLLSLEDTESRLRKRMIQMVPDLRHIPPNLDMMTEFPRLDADGLAVLDEEISENGYRLVIIDTWGRTKPIAQAKRGENAYESDVRIVAEVKRIADKHECSILLVHHLKKGGSKESDWLESLSGSMGLSATVDGLLAIERERAAEVGILKRSGRDLEDDSDIGLKWLAPGWEFSGNAREMLQSTARKGILASIAKAKEPVTPKYIALDTGGKDSTVRVLLMKMKQAGLVAVTSDGKYFIPQREESDDDNAVNSVNAVNGINSVNGVNAINSVSVYAETGTVNAPVNAINPSDTNGLDDSVYGVYTVYADDDSLSPCGNLEEFNLIISGMGEVAI